MISASLRRATGRLLDLVLPPRCVGCGQGLVGGTEAGALCAGCWSAIEFLAPPFCRRCGYPFEVELGADEFCPACRTAPPVFDRARAVFRYDAGSRALLLSFKHADRTDLAPAFGRWLARAGAELLAEADLVTPVPLHWTRLFARRYNQAGLLAQAAARQAGRPFRPDLLIRRRKTAPNRPAGPPAPAMSPAPSRCRRRAGPWSRASGCCWWTMSGRPGRPWRPAPGPSRRPGPRAWMSLRLPWSFGP
jgi:predicted amidophosphoribosyltransferase